MQVMGDQRSPQTCCFRERLLCVTTVCQVPDTCSTNPADTLNTLKRHPAIEMPTTRVQPRRNAASVHDCKHQCTEAQPITELPQPLLDLILIARTSTNDKKALRQACKFFQQTLDNSITCLKIRARDDETWQYAKQLLWRMQHVHSCKAVVLDGDVDSLLGCLPAHITSLALDGYSNLNIKIVRKLTHLASLSFMGHGKITGLEYISGLTRLHCQSSVGSLAHLAPTLKHLSIDEVLGIQKLTQLTNLEILEAYGYLTSNFFQNHSQLPLKHLGINSGDHKRYAWGSAPTTLTRLTINGLYNILPGVLPTSITHLQLLCAYKRSVEQVAEALPWLRRFDLRLHEALNNCESAFAALTKFTKLQSFIVCVRDFQAYPAAYCVHWQHLATMPELMAVVGRGVKVRVIEGLDEFKSVFMYPCHTKSVWATHY